MNETQHILETAIELLECGWIQGGDAADAEGNDCHFAASGACQWCVMGAIAKAAYDLGTESYPAIDALASYLDTADRWIAHWNDEPGRTVDEVASALRGALQTAA